MKCYPRGVTYTLFKVLHTEKSLWTNSQFNRFYNYITGKVLSIIMPKADLQEITGEEVNPVKQKCLRARRRYM